MTYVVVIRGPLGIGKTTVATRLAEALGATVVSIDRILEEHDLEEWVDGYISVESFVRANAWALRAAEEPLGRGAPVVVDGNFYWETQLRDLVDRLAHGSYVFTLVAPVEVCIERDRRRVHPLGEEAVHEVYAKATTFTWGTPVDAARALDDIVREILGHLPTGPGAAPVGSHSA